MRLCTDYEQINKSPYASYHQHALVSPDTLALSIPDQLQEREDEHTPPKPIHGLFANHLEAQKTAQEWGEEIHACSIKKAARQQKMTYNCVYAGASTDPRFSRLDKLDKVSCGLAPLVTVTTPTMDLIADCGVEPRDLGRGMDNNQQVVMPYYVAYQEVRKSVVERSTVGPVETLRHGLFKDSSDWDEVKFVSEKQVIEQMAGKALAPGIGSKLMANFTRLMRYTLGAKDPEPKTPANKTSAVKQEMTSSTAPGQEFDGEYNGYVPEGRFVSSMSFVRSYINSFTELVKNVWSGRGSNPATQPYIPSKAPMIFRCFSNEGWNPRDWITKRLNLTPRVSYWEDEGLMAKVHQIADPIIQNKRKGVGKAKDLQDTLSALFNDKTSIRDSHLLIWMICLHIHAELEGNSKWSLAPLYTQHKLSSIYHFIYHLTNDLGNVAVMKALSQRGHSPRLYQCEEGTYHYPGLSQTLWADVGNAMYGHLNKELRLISDAPGIKQGVAGDVIEIAYNLYAMYATLNIDVALLLDVDPSVLQGWWAQVNLIQRDAYIHTAAMLAGKGPSESRFELVCIYVSGLTQLNATEAISVVKGKESHTATCPVPWCRICGSTVGKLGETASIGASAQSFWSHCGTCMQNMMYTSVGDKFITPLQIPGDYHPNMDHLELIEAQITREGMLAYESITEASLAGYQEMILFKRREYFDALHTRYSPAVVAKEQGVINFCYPLMHMIATGQLFEPYVYHPTASGEDRRQESEYCLERLEAWIKLFNWKGKPKNVNMDWEGACLDAEYLSKWDRAYTIPDLCPEMRPEYHPTSFHVQSNAVRMILPAKGMLPVGSYIGSPGFGLIHPNTITAAVLQNAGFVREDDNPDKPMKFDAFSLAPNFDIPTGRCRMMALNGMITDWELYECPQKEHLVCIPPEDLTPQDLFDFQKVPVGFAYQDHLSPQLHQEAFEIAKKYSEDQLLSCHMAPMLSDTGTNLRAMLYQHALSRAGLDTTPLRDMLTKLDSIIDQAIAHSWLNDVDYNQVKQYIGDHPSLAEKYPVRKFRQLLWDVVGCEATLGEWRRFTSEEQRLLLYASFYGLKAPEKVPYQKGFRVADEDYQLIVPDVEWEYHSQYLTQNSYKISGEEGEPEPVITPPPPTAPELEDPLLFDPKVTGIWDHLIALMTDEQKAQLKEAAKSEEVTPSFRHVASTPRDASPSSEGARFRGPSRKNPLYLGRIAIAAHKAKAFVKFQDLQNSILPCDEREAVALFSSPPWIQRVTACTTSEEVIEVFCLYHQQCMVR